MYENSLQHKDKVVPHIVLHPYYSFNANMRPYMPNCVSGGEFCGVINQALGIDDGRVIVYENLRQKCIYKQGKIANSTVFFDYMVSFYDNCLNLPENSTQFNEKCSNDTMDRIGINKSDIYTCLNNSFEGNYLISKNSILSREMTKARSKNFIFYPDIIVNGKMFLVKFRVLC